MSDPNPAISEPVQPFFQDLTGIKKPQVSVLKEV